MFGLFYFCCCLYQNDLTNSLGYALFWYLPLAATAGWFFLNTASNPGYLDEFPSQGGVQAIP
jgi:hypothetical protein